MGGNHDSWAYVAEVLSVCEEEEKIISALAEVSQHLELLLIVRGILTNLLRGVEEHRAKKEKGRVLPRRYAAHIALSCVRGRSAKLVRQSLC